MGRASWTWRTGRIILSIEGLGPGARLSRGSGLSWQHIIKGNYLESCNSALGRPGSHLAGSVPWRAIEGRSVNSPCNR